VSESPAQPYLLETSVAVKLIRAGLVAAPGACISEFTLTELNVGAAKQRNPDVEQKRISRSVGFARIIKMTERTMAIYTEIWIELEKKGQLFKVHHDLWNAALAIELGIPLHGCDRHFERISQLKYVHID
jgi:predicted nucleic acid-binding protein